MSPIIEKLKNLKKELILLREKICLYFFPPQCYIPILKAAFYQYSIGLQEPIDKTPEHFTGKGETKTSNSNLFSG